jgi:hypothetical protein
MNGNSKMPNKHKSRIVGVVLTWRALQRETDSYMLATSAINNINDRKYMLVFRQSLQAICGKCDSNKKNT